MAERRGTVARRRRRDTRGGEGQSHTSSVGSIWNEKWLSGGEKRRLPSRERERRKHKQVPKIESEEERTAARRGQRCSV